MTAQAMVTRRAETLGSVHDQRGGEAMRHSIPTLSPIPSPISLNERLWEIHDTTNRSI